MAPILASLVLLGALCGAALADELDERISAEPGGTLELDLDLGDGLRPDPGSIEILTHDAAEVRLLASPTGWGASGVVFRVDREGESIRVYGAVQGAFSWMFGGPNVRVRAWVPRQFSIDARSTAGPIRVENLNGVLRLRGAGAPIEVVASGGSASVRSDGGDVLLTEWTGDARVRATTGRIELAWVKGDVDARTGEGDIDGSHLEGRLTLRSGQGAIELDDVRGLVEAQTERGDVRTAFAGAPAGSLETRRGSIEVRLPKGAGLEIEAETRAGEIEIATGLLEEPLVAGRAAGPINGGGRPVRLYTARGDIGIR